MPLHGQEEADVEAACRVPGAGVQPDEVKAAVRTAVADGLDLEELLQETSQFLEKKHLPFPEAEEILALQLAQAEKQVPAAMEREEAKAIKQQEIQKQAVQIPAEPRPVMSEPITMKAEAAAPVRTETGQAASVQAEWMPVWHMPEKAEPTVPAPVEQEIVTPLPENPVHMYVTRPGPEGAAEDAGEKAADPVQYFISLQEEVQQQQETWAKEELEMLLWDLTTALENKPEEAMPAEMDLAPPEEIFFVPKLPAAEPLEVELPETEPPKTERINVKPPGKGQPKAAPVETQVLAQPDIRRQAKEAPLSIHELAEAAVQNTRAKMLRSAKRKNAKKKLALQVVAGMLSLLLVAVGMPTMIKNSKFGQYAQAEELLGQEEYAQAQEIFIALYDYADARKQAQLCKNMLAYQAAHTLMTQKEYGKAALSFSALGGFRDSPEKVKLCYKYQDYQRAEEYFAEKNYPAAQTIYSGLGGFQDSIEKARKCNAYIAYQKAEKLYADGKYKEAMEYYIQVPEDILPEAMEKYNSLAELE